MGNTSSRRRILLFTANRAEQGLVHPILAELSSKAETIEAHIASMESMEPATVRKGWGFADYAVTEYKWPNLALVPCDRPEMVGVALYLFYHNVPFAHLHAGDTGSATHDEIGRWIISRCASIHFCNAPESAQSLIHSGEESWRIHLVGSTAFDDVELDESTVPSEPFDLLLVHPDTYSMESTHADTLHALSLLDKLTVAIGPNRDEHWEVVDMNLRKYKASQLRTHEFLYYPEGVPRPIFLALMKHCKRFITNSSSALYELPVFGIEKWLNIGLRNAKREPLKQIEPGASKKIAEVLATVEINDRLLRKKFTI